MNFVLSGVPYAATLKGLSNGVPLHKEGDKKAETPEKEQTEEEKKKAEQNALMNRPGEEWRHAML